MKTYRNPTYEYVRCAEQEAKVAARPVVVVGAGPIGLALAIDLGQRGIPVVGVDGDDTGCVGSRAMWYA